MSIRSRNHNSNLWIDSFFKVEKPTESTNMKQLMQFFLPILLSIFVFLFTILFATSYCKNISYHVNQFSFQQEQNDEQLLKLNEIQHQLTEIDLQYEDKKQLSQDLDQSLSQKILAEDISEEEKVITTFFSNYMTWTNSKEYFTNRESLQQLYPDEVQHFVEVLYPEPQKYYDSTLHKYIYEIDANQLNMQFQSIDLYPIDISSDTHEYAAIVFYTTKDQKLHVKKDYQGAVFVRFFLNKNQFSNLSASLLDYEN